MYELSYDKETDQLQINIYGLRGEADEIHEIPLGDPVEFLEEVFRCYLTHWNPNLRTNVKEEFRDRFVRLVKAVGFANSMYIKEK